MDGASYKPMHLCIPFTVKTTVPMGLRGVRVMHTAGTGDSERHGVMNTWGMCQGTLPLISTAMRANDGLP